MKINNNNNNGETSLVDSSLGKPGPLWMARPLKPKDCNVNVTIIVTSMPILNHSYHEESDKKSIWFGRRFFGRRFHLLRKCS